MSKFNVQFLTTAGANYFKQQAKNKKLGQLTDEQMEKLYHQVLQAELIVRDYKTINYDNHPVGREVLGHPMAVHVQNMVIELHSKADMIALVNDRQAKKNTKDNHKTNDTQTKTNNKNIKINALRNFANS